MYSSGYENQVTLCDFNVEPGNAYKKKFCENFDVTNFIKEPTCFKNPQQLSWIDVILTKRPRSSQNSCAIEIRLSDCHKMTLTVMERSF